MSNTYAMGIEAFGDAHVIKKMACDNSAPGPHQIRIKHISIGLNFIDTYHRSGFYPIELPSVLGLEAVGIIEAVGDQVTEWSIGQCVGYCTAGLGAYASHRNVDAAQVFTIPDNIVPEIAASCLLKGLTCEYLIRRIYPVQAHDTVLFHAIAGGVGLLACQWLKKLGAKVIGTVSNAEKAEIAQENGCDHIIRYDQQDFVTAVKEITDGKGVPVVFDGVGKTTFAGSLDCLQPRGMMVSFGNASGAVEPFSPGLLASKGSLFFTRPTLGHYVSNREELRQSAQDFFDALSTGVNIHCNTEFALHDAAYAHQQLEGRHIIGQAVLKP